MNTVIRIIILGIVTLLAIVGVFMHVPIPQDPGYHQFADQRTILGIPHFGDVVTNIPFLIVGLYGLFLLRSPNAEPAEKPIYIAMFTGILLTAVGSAYYHCTPNNNTLVFDRIPMTIVFMSLLTSTIYEFIDKKSAKLFSIHYLFWALPAYGIGITRKINSREIFAYIYSFNFIQ